QHCDSFVPESTPKSAPQFTTIPFPPNQDGYFHGGEEMTNHPNSSVYYYGSANNRVLLFRTQNVYATDVDEVYKIEASLILETSVYYVSQVIPSMSEKGALSFELEGFWSKSTSKLCMVGSSSNEMETGGKRAFTGVLKLDGVKSTTSITSLVKGTLESLNSADDSTYFGPVSILMFPRMGYKFSDQVLKESDTVCDGGVQVPRGLSLSLPLTLPICSLFSDWGNTHNLEYASGCSSTKSCSPFGKDVGYLPQFMSFLLLHCSDDGQSLRFLVHFHNNSYDSNYYSLFNPNTSLVAEGSWDAANNRLCVVACRFLNAAKYSDSSYVGDCSIRLSLRFPAVWSIRNTTGILGQVWSNKTASNPGYFNRIAFQSYGRDVNRIPGLKYEYTLVEKAKKSCPVKPGKDKGKVYPDVKSQDMSFGFRIKNSRGRRTGRGSMHPIFVGDQAASSQNSYFSSVMAVSGPGNSSLAKANSPHGSSFNISYRIAYRLRKEETSGPLYNLSGKALGFQVSAEGIYNSETGILCMVGCKYLLSDISRKQILDSQDCDVRVSLQFPPLDSVNSHIEGSIESTRDEFETLYFKPISFTAVAYYTSQARESIWRMDMEIIMALISNSLVCLTVGYQIMYVKKHPNVFPFISLLMLVVILLGHMIPLVLNFEALFMPKQNQETFTLAAGGWLETNEVIVRAVTMVAFLLQFQLLMLVWSSKMADTSQKSNWIGEKRTLYVSSPLYLADLRCYAGLVLDGFLLPQILLNIFHNSRDTALSRFFYLGNTFVRLLPHAYDLYRAHFSFGGIDGSYMYAKPGADYYSTPWDIAISLGCVLFAAIIYLQQSYGGRCFLHKRFKEPEGYEKIAKFLILSTTMYSILGCCLGTKIPYSKHCALVVPESSPKAAPQFTTIPFAPNQDGYFLGGEEIMNISTSFQSSFRSSDNRVLLFRTQHVYKTQVDEVYKIEASLILETTIHHMSSFSHSYSSYSTQVVPTMSEKGPLSFELEGFWSKSTGKLCMVGSSSSDMENGERRVLAGVLKLHGVTSTTSITSLVTGTLESLPSAYNSTSFAPISLMMFPKVGYSYTEVSQESDNACAGGGQVPKGFSLGLPLSESICSIFSGWYNSYKLEYASGCNSTKSCSPFDERVGYLPEFMSLLPIQCSDDMKSLRFQVQFHNTTNYDYYSLFNPNTTLVAEGSWDVENNQLCIAACQIFNAAKSFSSSHIGDCSIRLSLMFPAVWSHRNTTRTVGHIWSNKAASDDGYFNRITFRSTQNDVSRLPGLKYNYTLVEKARSSCPEAKPAKNEGKVYPDAKSQDMRFDLSIKNPKGRRTGRGSFQPIFVGEQVAPQNPHFYSSELNPKPKRPNPKAVNMSYQVTFNFYDAQSSNSSFEVSAEGTYDEETGILCMVGCKYPHSAGQVLAYDSPDCEILLVLNFPPVDSNERIEGRIESTRQKSSPLYFTPITFSAVSFYRRYSMESIWRMDMEIIMALISSTLVCIILRYQILHVKKHPTVFPFISLLMLVIILLGYMIPLVLNFEALFISKQNRTSFIMRSGGWLEANEVIVRAMTMVAFLLHFRLLVLIWSSKKADGNQKSTWTAEKRTLYVSLPLYLAGALLVLWRSYKLDQGSWPSHSLWADLRSYAGLVLDGFLFPQILLNIFQNSTEKALSRLFYMGNTLVRLLPHAYDLYRAHYYVGDIDGSYIYAEPGEDYYSTPWDIVISLGVLLFAAIIYLQQRFGGRCFLHKRFKEPEGYEKVPLESQVNDDQFFNAHPSKKIMATDCQALDHFCNLVLHPGNKNSASFAPESSPEAAPDKFSDIPFAPDQDGYFLGGEEIMTLPVPPRYYYRTSDNRVLLFRTHNVYATDVDEVYKVKASLILETTVYHFTLQSYSYSHSTQVLPTMSEKGPLSFELEGFWSKSTGELSMVGSSSSDMETGEHRVLTGVLKLHGVTSTTSLTSLVSGTLESLSSVNDSTYFAPISLLIFPKVGYRYSAVAEESVCAGEDQVPKGWYNSYKLEYASGCSTTKSCSPFDKGIGYSPEFMSLLLIDCSDDKQSLRFQVQFHNTTNADYYSLFNPSTSLVAEGSWDAENNRLCIIACRILNAVKSFNSSQVEDCSIRLSLMLPAVWSMRNTIRMIGHIWSNKTANDPGYFNRMTFRSTRNDVGMIPGVQYNYTLVKEARNSCPEENSIKKEGRVYPDANSHDMRFDLSIENHKGRSIGWGSVEPIFVGDEAAPQNPYYFPAMSTPSLGRKNPSISSQNMSYRIAFNLYDEPSMHLDNIGCRKGNYSSFEVLAEGTYDEETGILCMVGCKFRSEGQGYGSPDCDCRFPLSEGQILAYDSPDCEILLVLKFPPTDSNERIEGRIESTRLNSSALYFRPVTFTAASYYRSHSIESLWRMDFETIMALISSTFLCFILRIQILHVKKHPNMFPFISLLMLVVLVLGHTIPVLPPFEALFLSKRDMKAYLLRGGGRLEVNEVTLVTMVAFFLQFWLIKLVWSSKMADANQKFTWTAEKKTLYVSSPLYVAGALVVIWSNRPSQGNWPPSSLRADLRSYAGLVLDGFLFPQILLNIYHNSRENALSPLFYMGNTFMRMLPHAYDIYSAHNYVGDIDGSYIYAEPGEDYYSTLWDIIISLGALLFAAIIYLQQQFGGRCFLPKRFKDMEGYE
ncbi:hypothetical protein Tsubulata_021816, partial [Turnera subulata]